MDLIDGLRAFVATAQTGSFTAAAQRLGLSNRLTSKYVAELESRLHTRLLQRTTRRVGLTPAGEDLLARAPALLDDLDALLDTVTDSARGFTGTLRISAPVTFGEIYVADLLARFAAPHPALTTELHLTDAHEDLASGGLDLAFRIGTLPPSSLRQRRLGQIRGLIVASPDYLARHGTPDTPEALTRHACIIDTNRHRPTRWELHGPAGAVSVTVPGRVHVNSARVTRALALDGQGVALCPDFVLGDDLAQGRLVRLLPDHETPAIPFSLVWLETRTLPGKLRALIDFAAQEAKSLSP